VSVALAVSRTGAYPASFFTSSAPTLSVIRWPTDGITLPPTQRARGAAASVSRRVDLHGSTFGCPTDRGDCNSCGDGPGGLFARVRLCLTNRYMGVVASMLH
jgi:hypothetical protein